MKKSAGTPSSLFSPGPDSARSTPLIQQVGPDFSRLSRDLNRVVLKIQHQSEVASDCPMHSQDQVDSRRGSRADVEYRRGSRGGQETGDYRRGRPQEVTQRSSSAEINSGHHKSVTPRLSNPEQYYQSLPRRLSSQSSQVKSSKVDRRQSFQDFKTFREKFTGPLDFKNTLRSAGGGGERREERDRARKGRHYSEPRDSQNIEETRRGGYWLESDFDFRSPPSTRDNSRERRDPAARDYYAGDVAGATPRRGGQVTRQPVDNKKYQYGYQDLKNQLVLSPTELKSPKWPQNNELISPGVSQPVSQSKDPLSPRRVEFADEVFNFPPCLTPATSRPASRCESPNPRGILRHTLSDPQRGAGLGSLDQKNSSKNKAAVRSSTTDLTFCRPQVPLSRPTSLIIPTTERSAGSAGTDKNNQPLVKILLPDEQADSDDTLIEEKHETEASKERDEKPKRSVAPALADWNRTQSFPPAASQTREKTARAVSDQSLLSSSESELNNDLDLIRGHNHSLRLRVGDLEQQVHDNNDEIKCLKATLAECLRKVGDIETKIKQSEFRPKRRDLSEGSKSKRNPFAASSNFGSQDFSGRTTFEISVPPQRGTYAPRQR